MPLPACVVCHAKSRGAVEVAALIPSMSNVTEATATLSVAVTDTGIVPLIVEPFVGVENRTVGGVVSAGVVAVATESARAAFIRPLPYIASQPGRPRSSADWFSQVCTCAGVRFGLTEKTNAATPATMGDAT